MDITPIAPEDRQLVEAYGGGGFRVSGADYGGSIIVFPTRTLVWPVAGADALDEAALEPLVAAAGLEIDVVLLGCGRRMRPLAKPLREVLRSAGLSVDPMDTGAACRTYNVLIAEDRRVAAALIAVD